MDARSKAILTNINDRIRYAQKVDRFNMNVFSSFYEQVQRIAGTNDLSSILTSNQRFSMKSDLTYEQIKRINELPMLRSEYRNAQRTESERAKEEGRKYSHRKAIVEYRGRTDLEKFMNLEKNFLYLDARNGYKNAEYLNSKLVKGVGLRSLKYEEIMPIVREIQNRHKGQDPREHTNMFETGKTVDDKRNGSWYDTMI